LQAVEGAVDFDRGQLAACVFEFALLRQVFRIKHATPWGVGPASNANPDSRFRARCHMRFSSLFSFALRGGGFGSKHSKLDATRSICGEFVVQLGERIA
jgi:hypothetical protein